MLWWLSPGEEWDVVWINCKTGATTENQDSDVVYGLRGVCYHYHYCHGILPYYVYYYFCMLLSSEEENGEGG